MSNSRLQIKAASREMVRGKSHDTFLTFTQPLEHKNGYVFLLLDLDRNCKTAPNVISLLRESVERLGRNLDARSHLQHRFEQTLQAINEELAELIETGMCPVDSINAALGILREDTFILSATGGVQALFMRRTAKQRFRVFDLSQNLRTESGQIDTEKVFSVVLDGDLKKDDVLLLASRNLHNNVQIEDLHPLLTTLPPTSVLETIEQYLPVKAQLSIVLFQMRAEKSVLTGFGKHTTGKSSMNALLETEKKTTSMLDLEKPQLQQRARRFIELIRSGSALERKEALRGVAQTVWKWLKLAVGQLARFVTSAAISVIQLVRAAISRGSERERALGTLKSTWSRTMNTTRAELRNTSLVSRLLLVGGAICLVLFVGSVVLFQFRGRTQADAQAFAASLDTVQEKIDRAEASRIYDDETLARQLLNEAIADLDAIETKKTDRMEQIDTLRQTATQNLDALRGILTPELTTIAVVNNVLEAADGQQLFFRDGQVGTLNGTTIDTQSRENATPFDVIATYPTEYLGLSADDQLYAYDPATNTERQVGINTVEGAFTQTTDMIHYGERLYVLTPTQIYRHQRVENGEYGPGVAWVGDAQSLQNATALTVDGAIWVGDGNRVRRYEQGQEVGASLASIDPPLASVNDLWTDADTDLLYILDKDGQRVVVYNKVNQEMVAQYVDPQFGSALGLHVDAATRTAYIYAPTTVFTFPLVSVLQ